MITEAAFVAEATAFLDAHAKLRTVEEFRWGEGSDDVSVFPEITPAAERQRLEAAKAWRAVKFDAGFGWISGPLEYGGRGLPFAYERTFALLEVTYDVPYQKSLAIGLGMVAPTILAHGTDEVKDRYLRALHRGDLVACQLFSEPGAGSDLASVSTRAERDDDGWVLNGQKVWTSGAHLSDIGEALCRTNPAVPKHRGLTAFIVDMCSPGVEVRPLRQMTGGTSFNEIFFTDVRVPDSHRLGEVDGGWGVALTTLMNERGAIVSGNADSGMGFADGQRLIAMVRHLGLDADPLVRQELATVYSGFQVAKLTAQRAAAKAKAGLPPGPEQSLGKLALTRNLTAVAQFVSRAMGPRLTADTGEWGTYAWNGLVLGAPGYRIAGGTDEVMRNIIGERVLGLPKEPSSDTQRRPAS